MEDKFKPIRKYAIFVVVLSIIGMVRFLQMYADDEIPYQQVVMFIVCFMVNIVAAVLVLMKTSAGYYLVIGFLHILSLAWPIGTKISRKVMDYFQENDIKSYFM